MQGAELRRMTESIRALPVSPLNDYVKQLVEVAQAQNQSLTTLAAATERMANSNRRLTKFALLLAALTLMTAIAAVLVPLFHH